MCAVYTCSSVQLLHPWTRPSQSQMQLACDTRDSCGRHGGHYVTVVVVVMTVVAVDSSAALVVTHDALNP